MAYHLTDAKEGHLLRLAQIEQLCFSSPWTTEQLRTQLKDSNHEFILIEDEQGCAQAYVGMMYVLDEGYISNVAVAPEHRRKGLADALIDELVRRAEMLGLSFVTLEVRVGNSPAITLYEKHGFSVVGRRKDYYDRPKEDALLMTKYLK